MLWNLFLNCMLFLECSFSFFYLAITCSSFISHFKYILSVQVEKEMANHSSTLAWRIPRTEEPGGLQSMGSQRVGHNCATNLVPKKNSEPAREARHWVVLSWYTDYNLEVCICVSTYLMCILWEQCESFIHHCIPMVSQCLVCSSDLSKLLNEGKSLVGNVVDLQTAFKHTITVIHITWFVHEVEIFEESCSQV